MAYVVFCRAVGTAQVLGVLWIGRTAGCEAATSVRHLVDHHCRAGQASAYKVLEDILMNGEKCSRPLGKTIGQNITTLTILDQMSRGFLDRTHR